MPFLPHCVQKYKKEEFWEGDENTYPNWLQCGSPHSGTKFHPVGALDEIWDFSVSSLNYDYLGYLINNSQRLEGYEPTGYAPVRRWFTPGWVEPVWIHKDSNKGFTTAHPDLFCLAAALTWYCFKNRKHK